MAISRPQPALLKDLLKDHKYQVPFYQRSYAWSIDEAEQLWDDLNDNDPPYFLGILLLKDHKEENYFEVVDGQQRLSTLILLIRAAVEVLEEGSELRHDLQKYIKQKEWGEKDNFYFTLDMNMKDNNLFHTLIDDNTTYQGQTWIKKRYYISNKNLQQVKETFLNKFNDLKAKKGGTEAIVKFVSERILKLTMLDVHLDTNSDAYLFFETLNDRGMALSIADLVKNRVCAESNVTDKYSASIKMDNISSKLGENKIKSFLLHYCWALTEDYPPPPRKKLMEWYDKVIKEEGSRFIETLKNYADLYYELLEPRKSETAKNKDPLTFIKVLGASRCYPLLLVGKKYLSDNDFLRLCKAIEFLTVRHSTIAKRDAKILEKFYQDRLQDIKEKVEFKNIIENFKKKCNEIPDDVFESSFKRYETENSQIAKYLLLKIDNHLIGNKSIGVDWEQLTLEHILAKEGAWEGREEFRDRLGNMTLLSEKNNKELSNKSFENKKPGFEAEKRIKMTIDLLDYLEFTKDTIIERQASLAKGALSVWNPNLL